MGWLIKDYRTRRQKKKKMNREGKFRFAQNNEQACATTAYVTDEWMKYFICGLIKLF